VIPADLAQAGPVAILLTGIGLLYRAFVKGDIVPGSIYRAAIERAEKAETQAERNTDALEAVTATVKAALDQRAIGGSSGTP
jgi:hypothetical protein